MSRHISIIKRPDGGTLVQGGTVCEKFHVEFERSADRQHCTIIDEHGNQVGTAYIEFRDPDGSQSHPAKPKQSRPEQQRTWAEVLKGLIGLAKAEIGIDAAVAEAIKQRKSICMDCEHYDFGVCAGKGCGCYLAAKVKIAGEQCPLGKW